MTELTVVFFAASCVQERLMTNTISWYTHTDRLPTPSQGYDTEFHPSGSLLLVTHDDGSLSMFDPRAPREVGKCVA